MLNEVLEDEVERDNLLLVAYVCALRRVTHAAGSWAPWLHVHVHSALR